MLISIIIPCYNEEKTIASLLRKVVAAKINDARKEIILVDDNSSDKSYSIAKQFLGRIKIFKHGQNFGKGKAIETGIKNSHGEFILIQDADLEYEPGDYNKLVKCAVKTHADVVYGSRFLDKKYSGVYYLGNRVITWLTNMLYNAKLTDIETCYKLFKKDIFYKLDIRAKGFDFEPEFTAKCLKRGYKIQEVPVHYYPREREDGKKIRFRHGLQAALILLKYRLVA
ncbi:MAG TPA: glycosyltransferase family 2 protein [Candidatus Nanoarchaeia archaeon]|nr:glycosyltransferase family 2 protein [Candidatus Nanoarchaeia archaeon]